MRPAAKLQVLWRPSGRPVANAWAAGKLGSGGLEGGKDKDLGSIVEHQTRQQDVRNSGCGLRLYSREAPCRLCGFPRMMKLGACWRSRYT